MPNYARVRCSFWDDPDILPLSPHAKLVYLWCFTNRACGISGLYRIGLEVGRQAVGLTPKEFETAWTELLASGKVLYDTATGSLWVVGKLKQETVSTTGQAASPKTLAGAVRELSDLPDSVILDAFQRRYQRVFGDLPAYERFRTRHPMPHACPIDGASGSGSPIPIPIPIPNNNPLPITRQARGRRGSADYTDGFSRWFGNYPKHRRKQKFESFQEWKAQDLDHRVDELLAVLEAQKASHDWTKDGGKWIPHPHRYLAKRRHEDVVVDAGDDVPGECSRCHEPTPAGETLCEACARRGASPKTVEVPS